MFSQELSNIPVWSEDAEVWPHIIPGGGYDQTINAVMRALVEPRMSGNMVAKYQTDRYFNMEALNASLYTLSVINGDPKRMEKMDCAEKWVSMDDIRNFVMSKMKIDIAIYHNEEIHSTFVVGNIDPKVEHVIAFFIPRFFKPLFVDNRPTESEMAVLNGLLNPSSRAFLTAMANLAAERGLDAKISASKVANCTKIFMRAKLRTAQRNEENLRRAAEEAYNRYVSSRTDYNTARIFLEGVKAASERDSEESKELYEFVMTHPNFRILRVGEDGYIELVVLNYLDMYDADGFEVFNHSFFERVARDTGWNVDDVKLVLDHIFSADPMFRVRTCGYYMLNIDGYVSSERSYSYNEVDRIPNPHLNLHACLGQHGPQITECLKNGNILGALMQCNASVMSVNIHETSATFAPFCVSLIRETTNRYLETKDGTRMNAKEALEHIKKKEGEAE